MKKNIIKIVAAVLSAFMIVSCGGSKDVKDDCGCFMDFDAALAHAKKENKDILAIVTLNGSEYLSSEFVEKVTLNPDFGEKILKKYEVVHYDFSQASSMKTVAPENGTEEEIKKANELAALMAKGYSFANLLHCQSAPAIYRFTKNGMLIDEVEYEDTDFSLDSFVDLVASYDQKSADFYAALKNLKSGSVVERAQKLDELFTSCSDRQKLYFIDIFDEIIKLDKNNESGLLGKFIIISADLKSTKLCSERKFVEAANTYVSFCDKDFISNDEKINGYFMGAYILGMTRNVEHIPQILTWINNAKELNPDSESLETLNSMYEYFEAELEASKLSDEVIE